MGGLQQQACTLFYLPLFLLLSMLFTIMTIMTIVTTITITITIITIIITIFSFYFIFVLLSFPFPLPFLFLSNDRPTTGDGKRLISIAKLENIINNKRSKEYASWEAQLFQEPMVKAPGDQRNFVWFDLKMIIEGRLVQIIGFAHLAILFELGGTKLHGFADTTFDVWIQSAPHHYDVLLKI